MSEALPNNEAFPSSEAIKFGWQTMKKNIGFFVIIFLIGLMVYMVPDYVNKKIAKDAPLLAFVIALAAWVLQMIISLGYTKISLKLCDEQKPEMGDLFSCYPLFLRFLLSGIIYSALCFLACLPAFIAFSQMYFHRLPQLHGAKGALAAPFSPPLSILGSVGFLISIPLVIYVSVAFGFYVFFIVDKNSGPVEALKKSAQISRGKRFRIFLFFVTLTVINILGAVALLIGLVVSIPTTMVASAYFYRKLAGQAGA